MYLQFLMCCQKAIIFTYKNLKTNLLWGRVCACSVHFAYTTQLLCFTFIVLFYNHNLSQKSSSYCTVFWVHMYFDFNFSRSWIFILPLPPDPPSSPEIILFYSFPLVYIYYILGLNNI